MNDREKVISELTTPMHFSISCIDQHMQSLDKKMIICSFFADCELENDIYFGSQIT
jgi:hypothetical protein